MKDILYHCSVNPIQRSKGRSATAAAAYRSAEEIHDEKTGLIHDYTRKGGVDFTKIIGWSGERSELWNAAELAEKRKDATTAREYIVALPLDLENEEKIKLACAYGTWLNKRHGVAVDVAIHGIDTGNPHAHILTTTRVVENNELGEKASREWADSKRKKHGLPGRKDDLLEARLAWEKFGNAVLEQAGIDGRMDHRSHKERGLDSLPQIHLGPKCNDRLKQGKTNERIEKFEAIQEANKNIKKLKKVNNEIKETPTRTFEKFAEKTGDRLDELESRIRKDKIRVAEFKHKIEKAQEREEEIRLERRELKEENKNLLKQREELNPLQVVSAKKIDRALEAHKKRFWDCCVELGRLGDKIIPKLQEGLNTLTERVKTMSQQFERINKSFEYVVSTLEQRGYYQEPEKTQPEPAKTATNENDINQANADIEKVLESVPDYTPSPSGPAPKF